MLPYTDVHVTALTEFINSTKFKNYSTTKTTETTSQQHNSTTAAPPQHNSTTAQQHDSSEEYQRCTWKGLVGDRQHDNDRKRMAKNKSTAFIRAWLSTAQGTGRVTNIERGGDRGSRGKNGTQRGGDRENTGGHAEEDEGEQEYLSIGRLRSPRVMEETGRVLTGSRLQKTKAPRS